MWTTPAKSDGKKRKRRTTMEVYDFEFEFRRDKAADAVAGRPLLPPVRIADCASCGWRERCNVDLEAGSGDPSLLPRVGYRQWRTLKDAGITNRAEVASLDYPTAVLATTVDLTRWYADAVNADPNTPIDDLRPRARTQTQVLLDAGAQESSGDNGIQNQKHDSSYHLDCGVAKERTDHDVRVRDVRARMERNQDDSQQTQCK